MTFLYTLKPIAVTTQLSDNASLYYQHSSMRSASLSLTCFLFVMSVLRGDRSLTFSINQKISLVFNHCGRHDILLQVPESCFVNLFYKKRRNNSFALVAR